MNRDNRGGWVMTPGRWRIRIKFGLYRLGLNRTDGWSAFSWGLGFCTGNAVRRPR